MATLAENVVHAIDKQRFVGAAPHGVVARKGLFRMAHGVVDASTAPQSVEASTRMGRKSRMARVRSITRMPWGCPTPG